jgi:hypothetical protein
MKLRDHGANALWSPDRVMRRNIERLSCAAGKGFPAYL